MPIGVYCLDTGHDDLDVIAKSPFNCIMSYRAPSSEDLDACEARGIKVIYDVRAKLAEKFDDEAGFAWIREHVPQVMRHPAIMAWYADDESPVSRVPRLAARKRLLNEIDPNHPVWAVQDKWRRMGEFVGTFDVFGTDPYPVSKEPVGNVSKAVRLSRRATGGKFPVWQVVQGFRWNEKFRSGELMPTPSEFRSMTWQAVAEGANGLVYFRYHQLRETTSEGGGEWLRDAWPQICAAALEVKKYEDVIMSAGDPPGVSGAPEELAVRTWRKDGVPYVLVANTTTNKLSCALALDGVRACGATADFAGASVVRAEDGRLVLDLLPIGYAFVKVEESSRGNGK